MVLEVQNYVEDLIRLALSTDSLSSFAPRQQHGDIFSCSGGGTVKFSPQHPVGDTTSTRTRPIAWMGFSTSALANEAAKISYRGSSLSLRQQITRHIGSLARRPWSAATPSNRCSSTGQETRRSTATAALLELLSELLWGTEDAADGQPGCIPDALYSYRVGLAQSFTSSQVWGTRLSLLRRLMSRRVPPLHAAEAIDPIPVTAESSLHLSSSALSPSTPVQSSILSFYTVTASSKHVE